MSDAKVKKVGVVGGGTMGSGIVQTFAQSGYEVTLLEASDALLDRAWGRLKGAMSKLVEKGKVTAEASEKTLGLIQRTTDPKAFADVDLVVEAIFEDEKTKIELLGKVAPVLKESAILASNTSSISITKLARHSGRADRFIGMHFFNPVPVMKLVEVIRGLATSQPTFETVMATATALGKTPVEVHDYPGFVSNRILMPMINEAVFCLHEGVASREAIDTVMKLGMNHPMGPLTLADFIGLDVCLDILAVLYDGFRDPKFRPCPLLSKMVAAGHLGRKSGKGFYDYPA